MYSKVLLLKNLCSHEDIDLPHPVEGKTLFHQLHVGVCVCILYTFYVHLPLVQEKDIFLWKLSKLQLFVKGKRNRTLVIADLLYF